MKALLRAGCAAFATALAALAPVQAQDDAPQAVAADVAEAVASEPPAADVFARDSYRIRDIVCPFKGQIDYKPGEISCHQLEVPENREAAETRMIELQFIKLAARKPEKWDAEEKGDWFRRADPIIYFTGGPGAKAEGYVKRLKDHGARDVRDLYILEQRGIGWSGDFCLDYGLFDPAPANVADRAESQRAGLMAMETCFAKASAAGVDLTGYNTIENARDVHALRKALGVEEWNVWGISYGSILGQAYLKEDPSAIRAAIIDAIVPLPQDITFHNIVRHFLRDMDLLQEACNADPLCAANFPDMRGRLEGAIRTVNAEPIVIDAIDTDLFPSGKAYIFADLIGGLPFSLFYEQKNYGTLPALIDAIADMVETKDYDRLRLITAAGDNGGGVQISQGMYNAISCNDGWARSMRAAFAEDKAEFPDLAEIFANADLVDAQEEICARYGMTARPAEQYAAVETDIRTLLVEGAMDPITPPPLAKKILPGFRNGTYVEFAYAGHGPTRSVKCAGDFLTSFYDNPDGELDTTCPDSMEAPSFAGPLFTTDGLAKIAATAAEDRKKAALPALWFGLPAFVLLFGAVIYLIAPVARLINGDSAAPTGGARMIAFAVALAGAAGAGGIAAGIAVAGQTNPAVLLFGLPGWTKAFAAAGLAAGPLGLVLLWLTARARMRRTLPIGVLIGLVLTGLSGLALASWLAAFGFMPV